MRKESALADELGETPQWWTAKRRAALVLDVNILKEASTGRPFAQSMSDA